MNTIIQLWLPILLSAVGVFVASSLIHMVFKWHNADYKKLPNEDDVRAAIRAGSAGPGQYVLPYCTDPKDFKNPEMQKKFTDGPVGFVMLREPCAPNMTKPLVQWFLLALAVAVFAGYLVGNTLGPKATFYQVARVVSIVTFAAYAVGGVANAIWWGKPWASTVKELLDAAIYAAVTGCVFGWLWPTS